MGSATSKAAQMSKAAMDVVSTTAAKNPKNWAHKDNGKKEPHDRECEEEIPESDHEDKHDETETYGESTGEFSDASSTNDPIPNDKHTPEDVPAGNDSTVSSIWATARKVAVQKVTLLACQAKDAVLDTVATVKKLGLLSASKQIGLWMKRHPWETAVIVVPLVLLAITAIALLATGFGPGGIVAGSAAAAIHAGIGNVIVYSLFATCTSAMMGGYGALIIFGGTWLLSTIAVLGLGAASRHWKSQSERALVHMGACKPRTGTESLRRAASYTYYGMILIAAYMVHRIRRWWQNEGKGRKQD